MTNVAIIYSTVDGHTVEICRRIEAELNALGSTVTVLELTPDSDINIRAFDRVMIGASIRYGKHRPEVEDFVTDNRVALEVRSAAFFSVNAVARKPEKNEPETNPYVQKFLARVPWQPALICVFGGKIEYQKYGFFDRNMIRFIMWLTKGPTALDTCVDFTDWGKVDSFAREFANLRD